ncbi:DegV family protein [Candidatus Saccharibacteria bacterium]|nr:DegV family protein [Candidatus Saccharibacteria bacterium]
MLVLFADTDMDLTKKEAKELGYKLISMPYSIGNDLIYPYESWDEFKAHEFYEQLRGGTLPKTSSISEEKYVEYFEPEFKKGNDIFYVHFSRNMSGTFDAMDKAVEKLKEKYPERKFYEVDTLGISILGYVIAKEIADLFKNGKTVEEVLEWAKKEVKHYACYFFADDLKFFKQSGRVSNLAGTMGTLLGIRPIIYMNDEGKMLNIGKEKGRFRAVEKLVGYFEELSVDPKEHRIILASADNDELVQEMKDKLEEKYGKGLKIETTTVNPTIGAHCGPDTVGLAFYAKHR